MQNNRIYIIDAFPIDLDELPELFVYDVKTSGTDEEFHRAIGSITYCLYKKFNGCWVKSGKRIISNKCVSNEDMEKFLREMWSKNKFDKISEIKINENFELLNKEIADFVAKGLFLELEKN